MEERGGPAGVFSEQAEGELLFIWATFLNASKRQAFGPLARPAFHDITGEVEASRRREGHG